MKLILSGGGGTADSRSLDKLLVKLIPRDKQKIIYIPIAMESRPYEECYRWIISVFTPLKFTNITMWTNFAQKRYSDLENIGAIYIGGGNTFKLLDCLRKTGFTKILKEFAVNGKIIYGGSAGAIILGKDIKISPDENKINLKNTTGLNLIKDHSIFCHYRQNCDLKIFEYVKKTGISVIAIPEKSGVYIRDRIVDVIGSDPVILFLAAKKVFYKPNTQFQI